MKKQEFNLSNQRNDCYHNYGLFEKSYSEEDVRVFIRLLKDNFCSDNCVAKEVNEQIINELAGERFK